MTTKVADSHINEQGVHFLRRIPYQSWTPVVSQSAGITFTLTEARFWNDGAIVHVMAILNLTSAGTVGNAVLVSGLPVAIGGNLNSNKDIGHVLYLDSGVQYYVGIAVPNTSTTFNFRTHGGTNLFGVNPAVTVASGDVISFQLTYERG